MKNKLALKDAIAIVQRIHDEARAAHPMPADGWTDRAGWQHHIDAGKNALERLASEHGAAVRHGGADATTLRLAGVSSSCTGGTWGVMTNWLNAARRKLQAAT